MSANSWHDSSYISVLSSSLKRSSVVCFWRHTYAQRDSIACYFFDNKVACCLVSNSSFLFSDCICLICLSCDSVFCLQSDSWDLSCSFRSHQTESRCCRSLRESAISIDSSLCSRFWVYFWSRSRRIYNSVLCTSIRLSFIAFCCVADTYIL